MAASLIYTIPLAFLEREALVPAMTRGLKAALRYAFALLVLLGFLLAPIVLNGIVGLISPVLGRLLGLATGAMVIPVVVGAIYCSYRTIFAAEAQAAAPAAEVRKVVAMAPRRQ